MCAYVRELVCVHVRVCAVGVWVWVQVLWGGQRKVWGIFITLPSLEARSSTELELAGSAASVTAGSAVQTVLRLQTCTHHICLLI